MSDIIDEIIRGRFIKTIICECTPGSGKSLLPIIAGKLLTAGLADALCWVVPRKTLQKQGESNFQDPLFREMLGHKLNIRSSTNDINPCRGLDGFITTYQAIGIDEKRTVLSDFSKKRYILVLDENQHVEDGGAWHESLQPIMDKAKYIILMTGSSSRGNGTPIALMSNPHPETTARIVYGRKEALNEKAIIPLHFSFSDGTADWIDYDGKEVKCDSIAKVGRKDAGKAIFTAISTDYAEGLMSKGLSHWNTHKKRVPSSKLLIVTANVALAKKAMAFLNGKYRVSAEIATSHESAEAEMAIKRFKAGITDILVGVAMFYEGFDCKQVSHIIALTHIRTKEWLEQMFARAVRIDPVAGPYETQCGYIFAPDDPSLRKVVSLIESEQSPFVKKQVPQNQASLFDGDCSDESIGDENVYGITPIGSSMTGGREITLGADPKMQETSPQTPSEIEAFLRNQIESHVRQFSFINRHNPKRLNAEIKQFSEKPRSIMTAPELSATLEHIKKIYPLNGGGYPYSQIGNCAKRRGNGKRVSTKAAAWYG
ncbi:MAG: hypothetical protein KAJ39_02085 [Gammaproteobacteria bacterium]|nr:hypothetical protein [Gammaproteobacteria bacterium]